VQKKRKVVNGGKINRTKTEYLNLKDVTPQTNYCRDLKLGAGFLFCNSGRNLTKLSKFQGSYEY